MYTIRMKNIREAHNLTQKQVSDMLGINHVTYSHYESEYYIIPIKHLINFCDTFHISLDYIFNFTDKSSYSDQKKYSKQESAIRIKLIRKELNMTQDKLAKILNTARTVITEYERGTNLIATPFLYEICKKYQISADYLLGKTNKKYLKELITN